MAKAFVASVDSGHTIPFGCESALESSNNASTCHLNRHRNRYFCLNPEANDQGFNYEIERHLAQDAQTGGGIERWAPTICDSRCLESCAPVLRVAQVNVRE
jgi:hypothetical protein